MILDSLDDAMLVSDTVGQAHPDFDAMVRREIRKSRDTRSGVSFRCGGCGAFVKSSNAWHSCGFRNDIRGRRNYGGYADGGNHALPF